jgi:hypothetical protein
MHRWENNIKMDFRETVYTSVDWIHLAQDRDQWRLFVNTVISSGSIKGEDFLDRLSDYEVLKIVFYGICISAVVCECEWM